MHNRILSSLLALVSLTCFSQESNIKVFSDARYEYSFPWAGGMNSCQYGTIDLDLDGQKDLVVFDRVGDRIMPFMAVSSAGIYKYEYSPEYAANFPTLSHWAIFADYNLDGKEDIFTYSPGYAGLKVFKNISGNELEFRLEVFPFLTSFQGGGDVNILVTYADYPAITDLDGDGDLDILTFWGLGSFVEKHRNMSIEKYGHADSLIFEKTDFCWGYFAESEETNQITLDTCLRCGGPGPMLSYSAKPAGTAGQTMNLDTPGRHTGSTFCILDLNDDQIPDLLLGDVDYPNLVALYNNGTADTARMTSYNWQYPPGDQTVDLFSMPAAFFNDFDFDGVNDLLVSPFDPNPFLPENFRSNWLYRNEGTNEQPLFVLQNKSFLQDQMLDFGAGAYPVILDLDNDGLKDMLVGNYGYYDTSYFDQFLILHTEQQGQLAFLKNTGSNTQPAFTFIEDDFADISLLDRTGIFPACSDLDGDGDQDMLLGNESGQLMLLENIAGPGGPADFALAVEKYQDIDVGAFSTPQLFDLDRDNLPDLVIGEKGGNLNYFRNTGTIQYPLFAFVTDSLGRINVTDYSVSLDGYSVPCFFRDAGNQTHLLVGSEQGEIFYYTGIDDNLEGEFILSDTLARLVGLQEIPDDYGYRSSPALADLDQDETPELCAGNFSGGLNYFGKNSHSPVNQTSEYQDPVGPKITIFPNPAHDLITISASEWMESSSGDLIIYNSQGQAACHYSVNFPCKLLVRTGSFPGGIYLLKTFVKNNQGVCIENQSFKIIILK